MITFADTWQIIRAHYGSAEVWKQWERFLELFGLRNSYELGEVLDFLEY